MRQHGHSSILVAMKHALMSLVLIGLSVPLMGCSSIARGVTEAVLDHKADTADTRLCNITGPAFDGIEDSIIADENHEGTTRVLMVHGIGEHIPGYATPFREKLVRTMNMDSMDSTIKEFSLIDKNKGDEQTGKLQVYRHFSSKDDRELLFFELTWANIADQDRDVIAFDDTAR